MPIVIQNTPTEIRGLAQQAGRGIRVEREDALRTNALQRRLAIQQNDRAQQAQAFEQDLQLRQLSFNERTQAFNEQIAKLNAEMAIEDRERRIQNELFDRDIATQQETRFNTKLQSDIAHQREDEELRRAAIAVQKKRYEENAKIERETLDVVKKADELNRRLKEQEKRDTMNAQLSMLESYRDSPLGDPLLASQIETAVKTGKVPMGTVMNTLRVAQSAAASGDRQAMSDAFLISSKISTNANEFVVKELTNQMKEVKERMKSVPTPEDKILLSDLQEEVSLVKGFESLRNPLPKNGPSVPPEGHMDRIKDFSTKQVERTTRIALRDEILATRGIEEAEAFAQEAGFPSLDAMVRSIAKDNLKLPGVQLEIDKQQIKNARAMLWIPQ